MSLIPSSPYVFSPHVQTVPSAFRATVDDCLAETIGVATASFGLTCTRIIPTKFLVGSVSRIITTPVPYLPFWFGTIVLPFLIVNKVSSNEEISISLAFEYEELLSVIRLNPKICSPISFDVSITSCSSSAIASPPDKLLGIEESSYLRTVVPVSLFCTSAY